MLLKVILFIVGLIFVVKGADYFIEGSSALAKKLRVPTLVIGLTLVSFGTSLPEMVVNVISSINGLSSVAIGNIVGSNIANLLLILGLAALFMPLKISISTVWKEIPFSLLAAASLFFMANDSIIDKTSAPVLSRTDGLVFLMFFIIFIYYVVNMALTSRSQFPEIKTKSNLFIVLSIIGGLSVLILGGKWVVDGAVAIAKAIGVSDYIISVTVVAVGTSIPELVTTVAAALKKEMDIAVGNIVGSNIFNIFFILGISALINPVPMALDYAVDMLILMAITLILFVYMFIGKKHEMERWQGASFILFYILFVISIIIRAK